MTNLHTHTFRCKHATGDVPDYIREARKAGISVLGFSDHVPYPDERWESWRMFYRELDDYQSILDESIQTTKEITVLKGLECEWIPELKGYYEDELLGKRGFQYLIGAEHWLPYRGEWLNLSEVRTPAHLRAYTDNLIGAMESGLFTFIAHPDMFSIGYREWDENTAACAGELFAASKSFGIPLEINAYGLRKPKISTPSGERHQYPWNKFWSHASRFGIQVVCNSDAHSPEDVGKGIRECTDIAKGYGMEVRDLSRSIIEGAGLVRSRH